MMQAITNLIWTVFSLLLELEVQVELFKTFMDACYLKVKLIFEKERNQCINFSEVKVVRKNIFTPLVYDKPTF